MRSKGRAGKGDVPPGRGADPGDRASGDDSAGDREVRTAARREAGSPPGRRVPDRSGRPPAGAPGRPGGARPAGAVAGTVFAPPCPPPPSTPPSRPSAPAANRRAKNVSGGAPSRVRTRRRRSMSRLSWPASRRSTASPGRSSRRSRSRGDRRRSRIKACSARPTSSSIVAVMVPAPAPGSVPPAAAAVPADPADPPCGVLSTWRLRRAGNASGGPGGCARGSSAPRRGTAARRGHRTACRAAAAGPPTPRDGSGAT